MFKSNQIFEVDYNDRDREGRLLASLKFARPSQAPAVDDYVWTADEDGNGCWGTVVGVNGHSVHIDLDRATWTRGVQIDSPYAEPALA